MLQLDRERRLVFDFNALAALEEATGKNILEGFDLKEFSSAKGLRTLLWAGLVSDDPKLTQDDVGRLLTLASLPTITEAIHRAFAGNAVEAAGGEETPADPPPARSGSAG